MGYQQQRTVDITFPPREFTFTEYFTDHRAGNWLIIFENFSIPDDGQYKKNSNDPLSAHDTEPGVGF
jgi:hypothetical protein